MGLTDMQKYEIAFADGEESVIHKLGPVVRIRPPVRYPHSKPRQKKILECSDGYCQLHDYRCPWQVVHVDKSYHLIHLDQCAHLANSHIPGPDCPGPAPEGFQWRLCLVKQAQEAVE